MEIIDKLFQWGGGATLATLATQECMAYFLCCEVNIREPRNKGLALNLGRGL
jgi:hypothetical protein